ncbi:hypothetical protein J4457_00795 [Candidatus Woesearchaeota archaeon]|nr:hypothetical protein [Candidatus Woesearchaeota archaeon]
MKKYIPQILALFCVLLAVTSLTLFFSGKISAFTFWIVLACCALAAYQVIPRMK